MAPFAPLSPRSNRKDNGQSSNEKRWPRQKGGFEIEKQCSVCKWWFDSFDPERKKCHLCLEGNVQQPPDDASTPNSPVQQSEVPQTLLNPLQLFDAPAVGNTQWDNTQYQAYGQGYGATFDPAYSPEMLSSLSVGYNMPNQMWTQGYDMSFNSSDFAGTMSNAAGGYTQDQMYGQGYITSPDLSFSSGTMSNPLGVYTPNQQWGQGHNIPFDSSYFLAALPNPTGGYAQNQANYQRGSPSLSDPPFQPGDAGTTVPKSKPLRPLLPRDKDAPPPPPPPQSESEDDDEDESQESSGYRAWLKSQPAYRDAVKKGKSSSSSKASGKKHKSGKTKK